MSSPKIVPDPNASSENPNQGKIDQDILSTEIKSVYNFLQGHQEMLLLIQKKILASPALNGGFETLIQKMDNFEKHQDSMVERVNEIHDAVYNPDEGLFARIKDTRSELNQIKVNQERTETTIEKDSEGVDKVDEKINDLESRVKNMESSYHVLKWIAITIGSGVIITTIKAIYNFISVHVKIF